MKAINVLNPKPLPTTYKDVSLNKVTPELLPAIILLSKKLNII